MAALIPLRVDRIVAETDAASSITLHVPTDLLKTFTHRAGQYLTVEQAIDGALIRRAYSISTSPHEDQLTFTVKRLAGGIMSTFLTQQVQVGDTLQIMPPQGKFYALLDPDRRVSYYFFAAGSGITPIYAIIKNILEFEPLSTVHLLYGSRDQAQIIYQKALTELAATYQGQFEMVHQLSQPFAGRFVPHWNGDKGRLETHSINQFLELHASNNPTERYFICGPGDFIDLVQYTLTDRGIHQKHILTERFNSTKKMSEQNDKPTKTCTAKIQLDGEDLEIKIAGQSIMQALIDQGYDPPFSCTSGVCTTCMAKLDSGTVQMDVNYGLDEDEVAEGYILTCQAVPTSDAVEITFEV